MKKSVLLLIILTMLMPLFACVESKQDDLQIVGETFFMYLSLFDYGACYDLLQDDKHIVPVPGKPDEPLGELTLAQFMDIYDRIAFQTVNLQKFSWQLEQVRKISSTYAELDYTLTYTCENIPSFTQYVTMPLSRSTLTWHINWSPAMIFQDMEWGDRILLSTLKQKRGEILDDQANAYAINSFSNTVYVRRSLVEDVFEVSTRLAALLQMDAAEIRSIIGSQNIGDENYDDYAVIKVYPPDTIDAELIDMLAAIPSVGIDRRLFRPIRYYPQGATFAHILGYTHPIQEDIDPARYDADSRVGANGLEKAYEDWLAGYRGREISIVKPAGDRVSIFRLEAIDGMDLTLTLDHELQIRAESLLERSTQSGVTGGAIVAIDPSTGDLLAAASYPDFNPNIFSAPIPDDVYQAMMESEAHQPLFDRITLGRYPPGSTVKPFIAAMALEDSILNQNFEFTGRIDWKTRQWLPDMPDWNAPPITRVANYSGPVNMENAIVNSDNIYFGYTALKAGWEPLEAFLSKLGFGQSFPFDVHVSTSQIRAGGSTSNLQLLASSGYGQGEMLITPLQMAYVFSAFANKGNIMQPRLVKEFRRMNGMAYESIGSNAPEALYRDVIKRESLDIINPMLRKVITSPSGSGRDGSLKDIATLGKTGTAEIGGNKEREIAWSISFVSDTDYERLVCVVLEVPTDPKTAGAYRHTCVKEMLSP